jgi:DNA-binding GntR family transcriptional regulator
MDTREYFNNFYDKFRKEISNLMEEQIRASERGELDKAKTLNEEFYKKYFEAYRFTCNSREAISRRIKRTQSQSQRIELTVEEYKYIKLAKEQATVLNAIFKSTEGFFI